MVWVHGGGAPDQIHLMGHSAGATLAAQVATNETFLKNAGRDLSPIKGVIAFSNENMSLNGGVWR